MITRTPESADDDARTPVSVLWHNISIFVWAWMMSDVELLRQLAVNQCVNKIAVNPNDLT